uniref:Uncharacterized protein n=1 Tax=Oryza glumipatula TaxID=40148 RepID=A0A0D9Z2V6_9ORYZ
MNRRKQGEERRSEADLEGEDGSSREEAAAAAAGDPYHVSDVLPTHRAQWVELTFHNQCTFAAADKLLHQYNIKSSGTHKMIYKNKWNLAKGKN